jgi:hypothetical protein
MFNGKDKRIKKEEEVVPGLFIWTLRIHGYITGGAWCLTNDESCDVDKGIISEVVVVGWSVNERGGDSDEPFGTIADWGGLNERP